MEYDGECYASTVYEGDRTLSRIDRADDHICIALDLLVKHLLAQGEVTVTFGDINPVTYRITGIDSQYAEAERIA